MNHINESTIEHHAIALFRELGYAYAHGQTLAQITTILNAPAQRNTQKQKTT